METTQAHFNARRPGALAAVGPARSLMKPARESDVTPTQIQLALCAQVRKAAQALSGRRAPADHAVHAARKSIKRARALLRLLRPALGRVSYRAEDVALRDVARTLSRVRDVAVMEASLKSVRGRAQRGPAHDRLARSLQGERLQARRAVLDYRKRAQLIRALRAAEQRIAANRMAPMEGLPIGSIRRLYRKGRKALGRAGAQPSAELLHEVRKHVKYLSLALEPFRGTKPTRRVSRAIEATGEIEDPLGRGHDLALLRARIEPMAKEPQDNDKRLLSSISKEQHKLNARALKRAQRFYARRAQRFISHLRPDLAPGEL